MSTYFLDTSAVVKRYVQETGTRLVLGVTDPGAGNDLYLARISMVEVVSAITRRSRGGGIPPNVANTILRRFEHDCQAQYHVVQLTESHLLGAAQLATRHALRAYDAVQLAVALTIQAVRATLAMSPLLFLSSDLELNAAAAAEGLLVDDPAAHP